MVELTFDKEKFDAVWSRVTGETPAAASEKPAQEDGSEELCRLMDAVAEHLGRCRALASSTCGRARDTLRRMADDDRRILKKLRVEHFVLTGGAYNPESVCGEPFLTVSEGLRALYSSSQNLEKRFGDTYVKFAQTKRRHIECTARLIEDMMR